MSFIMKRVIVVISVVALVGCGAPAPEPLPVPASVQRTNGEPGTLMLEAVRNVVLFDAPGGATSRSYLLAGQQAQVLDFTEDMRWYQVDCWQLSECWVPVELYSVRLVDASDNVTEPQPAPQRVRLASAAPSVVTASATTGTATDATSDVAWAPAPLIEPVQDDGPVRVNLDEVGAVEISDTVTLISMDHYLVRCNPGDELIVNVDATQGQVDFAVMGVEDARVYKDLQDAGTSVRLMVTTPQDFMISVATRAPDAAYDLYIGAVEAASDAAAQPRRLALDDKISHVFGQVDTRDQHRFVVDGPADGLLSVSITSPDDQASFAVVGMKDGRTYKWLYDDLAYWSWRLPSHQDYMILVGTNGETVPYSLSVALH